MFRPVTDRRTLTRAFCAAAAVVVGLVTPAELWANDAGGSSGLMRQIMGAEPGGIQVAVRFMMLVTVFGAVPTIVLLTTCYPRIVIVLAFLRRALGTQELPPPHVMNGLALVLTAVVMLPVWQEVRIKAYDPLVSGEIEDLSAAVALAEAPLKKFMLRHTLRSDLALMMELVDGDGASRRPRASAGTDPAGNPHAGGATKVEDLSFLIVLPAFVLSELKAAFQIGFILLLPFLMIDLVVSAVLLSMGMFMLPPVLVSLPLKVLVFVLVDGWNLVVGQVMQSFQ